MSEPTFTLGQTVYVVVWDRDNPEDPLTPRVRSGTVTGFAAAGEKWAVLLDGGDNVEDWFDVGKLYASQSDAYDAGVEEANAKKQDRLDELEALKIAANTLHGQWISSLDDSIA